jgi:hypothetical protein
VKHAGESLVVESGRRWDLDVRSGRQLHFADTVAALGVQRGGAKGHEEGEQSGAEYNTEASKAI